MADLGSLSAGFALGVSFVLVSGGIAVLLSVWAARDELLREQDESFPP